MGEHGQGGWRSSRTWRGVEVALPAWVCDDELGELLAEGHVDAQFRAWAQALGEDGQPLFGQARLDVLFVERYGAGGSIGRVSGRLHWRGAGGARCSYSVVLKPPGVGIVLLLRPSGAGEWDEPLVAMVSQTRPHGESLEIPSGGVNPGESLREAAARELREETGVELGQGDLDGAVEIASHYAHPSFCGLDTVLLVDMRCERRWLDERFGTGAAHGLAEEGERTKAVAMALSEALSATRSAHSQAGLAVALAMEARRLRALAERGAGGAHGH